MALTRIAQPNRWSAVYAPIIYQFQSSFGTGYQIEATLVPTSINSTNGFLTINFAGAHNIVAGDYVYINSDYSGAYRVISAPLTTSIIVDADDTVGNSITGVYKYAYKYTGSAKVYAKIAGVYTDIGTVTTKPVDDGSTIVFTFDVAEVIQQYITSNIPDLNASTVTEATDAFKEYYIETSEAYIRGVGGYPEYVESEFTPDYEDSYYTINEKVAVNATEQYTQQIGVNDKQSLYVFGLASGEIKFLSNQPDGVKYSDCRQFWFYFNNEDISDITQFSLHVHQYQNGTLLETNEIDYEDLNVGQHYFTIDSDVLTLNPLATTICVDAALPTYSFVDNLKNNNQGWALQDNGVDIQFGVNGALYNQNTVPAPSFSVNGYMDNAVLIPGFEYRIRLRVTNTALAPSGVVIIDAGGNGTTTYTITTAGNYDISLTADGTILRLQATYLDDNDPANEFILSHLRVQSTVEEHADPICFDVINEDCTCDNRYQLVWLNNKGGYSTEYVTGKATHGIDVDREGPIKYNLQPNNFSPSNRQYGNVRNVARKRITLTHESTNQDVHEWLAGEVMTSIDVLMRQTIDGIDYLIPIQLDTDSITLYKDRDKRFIFVCEALLAYDLQIQKR